MSKPPELTPSLWKSHKEGYKDSLSYMLGRQKGTIKSLKTPWVKFNDATTDGLEWNSLTVIGGRPASGKTLIKDQIVRKAKELNADQEFRVLEFQFEMLARTSAIREYCSVLGKDYKYLCSANGVLSDADLTKCYEYAKTKADYPLDIVESPLTVSEIVLQITMYMNKYAVKDETTGFWKYINTIVTIDHSFLVKKASYEKDKFDTLYNLGEALTELKRKYPIAFIVLSQLNRNVDSPERNEDGKYGNYILDSDIFAADALLQHADTVIGINRPALRKIRFYGPDRYIIEDDTVLVMHFLKCRNGDTRMSFFRAAFKTMEIKEMETPAMQERRKLT
jgi:replicative DNA helicase